MNGSKHEVIYSLLGQVFLLWPGLLQMLQTSLTRAPWTRDSNPKEPKCFWSASNRIWLIAWMNKKVFKHILSLRKWKIVYRWDERNERSSPTVWSKWVRNAWSWERTARSSLVHSFPTEGSYSLWILPSLSTQDTGAGRVLETKLAATTLGEEGSHSFSFHSFSFIQVRATEFKLSYWRVISCDSGSRGWWHFSCHFWALVQHSQTSLSWS